MEHVQQLNQCAPNSAVLLQANFLLLLRSKNIWLIKLGSKMVHLYVMVFSDIFLASIPQRPLRKVSLCLDNMLTFFVHHNL